MNGKFYEMDEWLRLVDKTEKQDFSEGAQWWLTRVKTRSCS